VNLRDTVNTTPCRTNSAMTQTSLAAVATPQVTVQRIAHFTDTYLPRRDGVVTSLQTLCAAMDAEATLTVVPRHGDQTAASGLLQLRSLPCGVADLRLGGWPSRRQIALIAAWRPDLIHVHTPGPMGLLGTLAAARLGVPLVHSYHTDLYAYADAYRVPATAISVGVGLYARRLGASAVAVECVSRRHRALERLNRLLMGSASAVVVPTPAVLSRGGLPVPPSRIFLVPAGVAPRPATPSAVDAFGARFGLSQGDPVVLFVGRVNREKGVELLLASFARAVLDSPRARLVLVGAVYEPRWLRRLIAASGIADRVVVTGQLGPDEVAAAYATAAVFAFPSLTDTQGLVLQEAAHCGLPVLLADAQLHRTGVLGDTALLASPEPHAFGGALGRLLAEPEFAAAAGARARERASQHTPERYAATMRDVYAFAAA
jgi:glycosyltransferase involved in cell wall biosynthesis